MISREESQTVTLIGSFGDSPGLLQPSMRTTRNASGLQIILEWAGDYNILASFQAGAACTPGAIALPQSLALVDPSINIKLLDSELTGDDALTGILRNTYVQRNDREIDADMAAGLISRTISMQWIERQEQLELFAARMRTSSSGVFNPHLLDLWKYEECADTKAEFKVRLFTETEEGGARAYLKTVALDNDDLEIPESLKGSALTKAIAQRIAQGVEYAGRNNIQIVASELWRVAPTLEYQCNEILPAGIPATHLPLFHMPVPPGTTFSWMRMSDYCSQTDAGSYSRVITYMGIPSSMMPEPLPDLWGERPFDAFLYSTTTE